MSEGVCAGAVAPTTIEHGSARESCRGATGLAAGTLSILLLLAGCMKVGPDFVKPDAPVAEQWTDVGQLQLDAKQTDHADWWKAFNDPVLDRLVDEAYNQNLTRQIAGLRILEARAQLGLAIGSAWPQQQQATMDAIYSVPSNNTAGSAFLDDTWNYSTGVGIGWEIDFWGKFRRGIESADAALLASIADYDTVLVSLSADVANTYVVIRTFEERLAIARENVKIQERSLRIAEVRFRNGATTELDVQQAKTLLFNTQATIPALEAGLRQAQNALSILLGKPPGHIQKILGAEGKIPSPPTQVAVGIPADLLRRRPDVRGAELQAAAQSALIGVAKADFYPSVALLGSLGLAATESSATTASVTAARRSVDLAVIQYRDGAADYTRVLNTQQSLIGQQDQSTITRGDIAGNLINMHRALGGGWQLRAGKDFVPESTKEQMAERTNWGDILTPDAQETALPARSTPDDTYRWPDW